MKKINKLLMLVFLAAAVSPMVASEELERQKIMKDVAKAAASAATKALAAKGLVTESITAKNAYQRMLKGFASKISGLKKQIAGAAMSLSRATKDGNEKYMKLHSERKLILERFLKDEQWRKRGAISKYGGKLDEFNIEHEAVTFLGNIGTQLGEMGSEFWGSMTTWDWDRLKNVYNDNKKMSWIIGATLAGIGTGLIYLKIRTSESVTDRERRKQTEKTEALQKGLDSMEDKGASLMEELYKEQKIHSRAIKQPLIQILTLFRNINRDIILTAPIPPRAVSDYRGQITIAIKDLTTILRTTTPNNKKWAELMENLKKIEEELRDFLFDYTNINFRARTVSEVRTARKYFDWATRLKNKTSGYKALAKRFAGDEAQRLERHVVFGKRATVLVNIFDFLSKDGGMFDAIKYTVGAPSGGYQHVIEEWEEFEFELAG